MKKQKLIFKMRNEKNNIELVCTHEFIGRWQRQDFKVVGYVEILENIEIWDLKPEDIPDNIL